MKKTFAVGILLCVFACQSKYVSIKQADHLEDVTINRIAFIPFGTDWMSMGEPDDAASEGAITLARLVERELSTLYYLIPKEKVLPALSTTDSSTIQQLASHLGRALAIDAVVTGMVTHYQGRKGSPYAISEPASVAFSLYLLDGKKGEILWSASFDKTQQSLSEDLGNLSSFFHGEWRWLTAEELMELGVKQVLEKFPGIQQRKKQKKLKPLRSPTPLDIG